MTSQFSSKFLPRPQKCFCNGSLIASSLIALAVSFSGSAHAEAGWQESSINMVGVKNYFMERCFEFGAGEKIVYRFTSDNSLDFNIHYHPGNTTLFKIEKENITELSGEFTSEADDHYCFTWINQTEVNGEWPVLLQYRVVTE